MKSLFSFKNLASLAIVTFFLVMAVGSDESSDSNTSTESNYDEIEAVPEKQEVEPDFSMDMSAEEVETVEVEPDFSDEEDETSSQGYVDASEIDTTFSDAQEPDFE